MNLVVVAAVIAVASAAKLDRTYLPPASAKTAGGSPGALQTPFASNSFNQGLGGIPKGGFENDFKGVVVDAASPGTRASADGETGLGAPRISYGSTNSKVGEAAFRGSPAGFRQFSQQSQFPNQETRFGNPNQIPDGQTAGTSANAQSFVQPGQSSSVNAGAGQSFDQKYQRSQELIARDQNANIVRFDSDVGTDSFSYSFETDNGISAEESGVATNGVQAQGGFSYTGDDGQVYSVTYTADEGGYQPKGDHLPTPPPIPEEILKSLEQNARDEAAGLIDDGSYDSQKYNEGSDYTENDGAGTHNGRQPAQFGNRPGSDASASGTFINQNNQPFVKPDVKGQAGPTGQAQLNQDIISTFGSSPQTPNRFGQASSSSNALNGFGQANQGIQQNRPSLNSGTEDSENANTFVSPTFETQSPTGSSQNGIQGQDKPQQPSFGRPQPNNNPFGSNNANAFGQRKPSSQSENRFGNNEYLPPVNGLDRRPTQSTPQRPGSFNQFSQTSPTPQGSSESSTGFITGSQSNVESQNAQFGGLQSNKFSNNQKPTDLLSSQTEATPSNSKPTFGGSFSQSSGSFSSFKPQPSTAQPSTELTTPLEDNSHSQPANQLSQSPVFGSNNAQSSQTQSPFGRHPNGVSQFSTPSSTSATIFASSATSESQGSNAKPLETKKEQSPFSNQRPQNFNQFNQENIFGQQSSNTFAGNPANDAQFSPSTQRPIFSQNTQAQGPDDSYYYNQPSKIFNTPNIQNSRFPNTPFNQFDRVTQRPSFSSQSNAQTSVSQGNFPGNSFGLNRQPQGSSRYPQPPVLTSVAPTFPTQGSTASSHNGITQASASSFAAGSPTPSSQFGSQNTFSGFGRRPTQQTNAQFNNQAFAQSATKQQGLGKQTTAQPQSFSNRNQFAQTNSFQNQQPTKSPNQQISNSDESSAVPSQQYDGEIYEYNKPAETLPPPTEEDKKAGFGQFGRQPTRPQFSQEKTQALSDSRTGLTQGRPQLAGQPSRPQFGQKTQASQQTPFTVQTASRQQFIQQTTPFANAQPTQPSFDHNTDNQNAQPGTQGNQFNAQANLNAGSQFGSRPGFNEQSNNQQLGSQVESRPTPCCRQLPNAPQAHSTQASQFTTQKQGQFGVSDFTSQGFNPDQASAQSFAGKGEVFGGPRKPPSFDEQTGYQY